VNTRGKSVVEKCIDCRATVPVVQPLGREMVLLIPTVILGVSLCYW